MATFIGTDQTTTYTLSAEEDFVLLPGVSMTSQSNAVQTASGTNAGHTIAIYGSIFAAAKGLALTRSSNPVPFNNNVTVGADATILSLNDDAIATNSDRFKLVNLGTITSMGGSSADHGLDLFANAETTNSGTISSFHGDGIRLSPTTFTDSSGPQLLTNTGVISGGLNGITYSNMWLLGVNSGTIAGGNIGVSVSGTLGLMVLTNSGTIAGHSGIAVKSAGGFDVLTNEGLIDGNVMLGGGDDIYQSLMAGRVTGQVQGEAGNDTQVGGRGDDFVDGGADNDDLAGRLGDDRLIGGTGNDSLTGGGGEDSHYGGDGADTLMGYNDDDWLDGGTGNDLLNGGTGNDTLYGGSYLDTMRGGAGDDVLVGGVGTDLLFGGSGADMFVWEKANESRMGALRDVVADFESGIDLIDIAGGAPGAISYLGAGAFTGGGGAELRVFAAGTSSIVEVDTDGNGAGNYQIEFLRTTGLTADDFIL